MSKNKNFEALLDRALLAKTAEQARLASVMESPEVWADNGPYATEDIRKAASICGLTPGDLAGYDQVLKRVRAVRGTTREVERLKALLDPEPRPKPGTFQRGA